MKKDYKVTKVISILIMLITIGASIYAYKTVTDLGVLPQKYINYIIYGLVGFNVLFGLLAFIPKVSKINKILQSFICVLVTAALIVVSIKIPEYKGRMERAFTQIPEEGTLNINVYTLANSPINDVKDLANVEVTRIRGLDDEYTDFALRVISRELNGKQIATAEMDDVYAAFEALFAGTIPALMVNETYADIIADNADFENFAADTKIVYSCMQQIKLDHEVSTVGNITSEPFIIGITGNDTWKYEYLYKSGRSDVNMVVVVNPTTKQILLVTVPRDSYLGIGGNSNKMDKLTHHTLYGYDEWKKSLNSLFGININYFVRVNFQSIVNIIDAIDGVDIYNPYEMTFKYEVFDHETGAKSHATKTFPEGNIHMNGEETLAYVRDRYHSIGGDMGRNKHQAIVIGAMVDKITSVSIISHIDKLLEAIEGTFLTDLEIEQIYALVQMQLDDMATWEIMSYSLTGSTGMASSYAMGPNSGTMLSMVFLSKDSINKGTTYIHRMLTGERISRDEIQE